MNWTASWLANWIASLRAAEFQLAHELSSAIADNFPEGSSGMHAPEKGQKMRANARLRAYYAKYNFDPEKLLKNSEFVRFGKGHDW